MTDPEAPRVPEGARPWLLSLAALVLYAAGAPLRDLFGPECRTALMAREMFENGVTLIPTAMGRHYPDYPPLYFLLESLLARPFGRITTLAAVLPSAAAAAGLVVVVHALGRRVAPRLGTLSAVVLATCPEFWLGASHATIDMLLALEVGVALLLLWRAGEEADRLRRLGCLGAALAAMVAAFFTKGPIGLVLPGAVWWLHLVVAGRWWAAARFGLAMVMVAAVCLGAQLGSARMLGGEEMVKEIFAAQVTGRVGGEANRTLLYSPLALFKGTLVWCLWAFAALWPRPKDPGDPHRRLPLRTLPRRTLARLRATTPATRLVVIWIATVLGIFTLASSRHARFLLPLYPPLAILLAMAVDRCVAASSAGRRERLEVLLARCFWIVVVAGLASPALQPWVGSIGPVQIIVFVALTMLAWIAARVTADRAPRLLTLQVLVQAAVMTLATVIIEPAQSTLESWRAFIAAAESAVPRSTPVVLYKIAKDGDGAKYALYSERAGSELRFLSDAGQLADHAGPQLLIIFDEVLDELEPRLRARQARTVATGLPHRDPVTAYLLEPATPPAEPRSPVGPARYRAPRATVAPVIDGRLDDPAWAAAPWTDPFVDIEGAVRPRPRHETRASMLWDDDFIYVGARLVDPHVWGTLTGHDSIVYNDNDFEVFVDPEGDGRWYGEVEVNALGTVFDLMLDKPYREGGRPIIAWTPPGLRAAVSVDGTLNDPTDEDRGWTVEIAIPHASLAEHATVPLPPRPGDAWRVNFSRVQWQHDVVDGRYVRRPGTREDNWVWTPQHAIDMHRPEHWGYVEFVTDDE